MSRTATGFATHAEARPELAAQAVAMALARGGIAAAQSILLFLTPHFARHAQPAVTAAARAGNCLQVTGCTTPGVFTEQDWSLEQPAAAALALGGEIGVAPAATDAPRLSLAMPDALDPHWLTAAQPRFGSLATGRENHAVGAVWGHGKWLVEGRCDAELRGARVEIAVSRGMQPLSGALEVGDVDGYELLLAGDAAPLPTLLRNLPVALRDHGRLPVALIFAAVIDPELGFERAVAEGRYALAPITGMNARDGTVTIAAPLEPGMQFFWALRHPPSAEQELRRGIAAIAGRHDGRPDFALLFSCIGRGPYFYGGRDHDLAALLERYPALPVLGCYGGGEIAPLPGGNSVLTYSAIAALAWPDV